jgi:hypothetical protein
MSNLTGNENATLNLGGFFQTTLTTIANFVLGQRELTNYNALRAYTGLATRVYIEGTSPITGLPSAIAGDFVYNSNDTTSADNGGTIIVDALGRRWYREFTGDVSVTWFGADPTGVSDSGAAIAAATNSCVGKRIKFPYGTYTVANQIVLTVTNYSWIGERNERGCNALGANSAYSSVQINFTNVTATQFMVSMYSTTAPLTSNIGPFEHESITFNFGQASGFQFGNEAIDPTVGNGTVERYVFSPTFRKCALIAQAANRTSSSAGAITRTGQIMVSLCKSFEAVLEDVSMYGSDIQVNCYGCDKPTLIRVRSQGSHLPIQFQSSGSFTVQHTLEDIQIENWTFTPIWSYGVGIAGTDVRLEQNDGTPVGSGAVNLTTTYGYTAAVTAGSGTLTFSSDMTNVLFPNLSIIQISNGTSTDNALVTAVSTTSVTIDTSNLTLTWSAAAATVTRLHGYGPIHGGNFDASYSNVTGDASTNTPAFVYRISRGSMNINGGMAQSGLHTGINSLVIGNVLPGAYYMNSQMSFSGTTPYVMPDTSHPFVSIDNWDDGMWISRGSSFRHSSSNPYAEFSKLRRTWVLTPKQTSTSSNNANLVPIKQIAGDAGTSQQHWAWYVTSSPFQLIDQSLPATTPGFIRMFVRIVSTNPTDTITVSGVSTAAGTTLGTINITNVLGTYELDFMVPAAWGSNPTNPAVQISGNYPFYLVGVALSEESEVTTVNYHGAGNMFKIVKGGQKTFAPSTATPFAQMDLTNIGGGNTVVGKLKIYATAETPNNGYANVYSEFIVSVSDYNNTLRVIGNPTALSTTQASVNSGVIAVSVALTATLSGNLCQLSATTTLTGSQASNTTQTGLVYELEVLAKYQVPITSL